MKKYLTMWQIWASVAVVLAFLLFTRDYSFSAILPFALFIICPLMMIFMMRGYKH